MKNKKTVGKLFAAVTTVFFLCQSVVAAPEPIDPAEPAGLQVCLQSLEKEVRYETGADVTIYKVADIKEVSGTIRYEYTDVFAGRSEDLSKEIPTSVILDMAKQANSSKAGITRTTDQNGMAVFDDLDQAVYLVTQTKTIEGFTTFEPFLSYVPFFEDGAWIYKVTAAPKIDYSADPTVTPTPTPTPGNTPPPDLPQTGQLKWPVPVLIAGGMVFVCAGLIVKFRKQPDEDQPEDEQ